MIATKAIGRSKMTWLRKDGSPGRQSRAQLIEALHGTLERLKTDYVDLYQLHWPDRPMRIFEGLDYVHKQGDSHPIEDILGVLGEFVDRGKVRFVGLSNETPWGVMTFLKAAETLALPRVASIQNAYNLVNRSFETGLDEIFHREHVSLLAYSPLGQGYLSGKYEGGALPPGSRKMLFDWPLRNGEWPPRHLGLCRARAKAWARSGANGPCLRNLTPLCHLHHHRRHDPRPAQDQYRRLPD
jgi:aryl-alcohol dehydrogenase-like predicted oxidoreductase